MDEFLAGPILRRTEPDEICVWVATSVPVAIRGEVFAGSQPGVVVGSGEAETARIGERLFVHLVRMRPEGGEFPVDALLLYDLVLTGAVGGRPRGPRSRIRPPSRPCRRRRSRRASRTVRRSSAGRSATARS